MQMKDKYKILVTGASSGIGYAIAEKLSKAGHRVYGIGRHFDESKRCSFEKVEYDLFYTEGLDGLFTELGRDGAFDILINNAGVAYFGTHETLKPDMISKIVRINLEVPMILSALALKAMKTQGFGMIINISSVTAGGINTHGCCYGASKAGLTSFSKSLFEEARKSGVRVVDIRPDMTDTDLYRNADFGVCKEEEAYLHPEDVAGAAAYVIDNVGSFVATELVIRPQKHRIAKK
ncbi:MAG: SDR family NAD(P)-dependent oxidoreductase [Clostridiales bacterium]|nr:SDR family NAD(P)-dependent oxidoreductase [Clostridiales bacterium]